MFVFDAYRPMRITDGMKSWQVIYLFTLSYADYIYGDIYEEGSWDYITDYILQSAYYRITDYIL